MPIDSWGKRRIYCGIKSRAKEERNALTEVARTEQRKPTSDVGLMNEERRQSRVQIKFGRNKHTTTKTRRRGGAFSMAL